MPIQNRVGGMIAFKIDGKVQRAKGGFTYNLGNPKREAIIGSDGLHGYKEVPQPASIEGEITDHPKLDLNALTRLDGATVTLDLAIGKTIVLRNAYYSADGAGHTEEGNIAVKFEGIFAGELEKQGEDENEPT
jgi:hypothetical protein